MKKLLQTKLIKGLKWFVFISAFTFLTIEIGFRAIRNFGWLGKDYNEVFNQDILNEGGFLIPYQNVSVINGYGDKVPWITNSKGFRNDKEFDYEKPPNTIRILSIGDSFTAGYRVGQPETYSYLLEKSLNRSQDSLSFEIMIANVKNPIEGLDYLKKYGLKYKPDIILLGITLGNDLSECFIHLSHYGAKKFRGSQLVDNDNFDRQKLESKVLNEVLPVDSYQSASEFYDYYDRLISPRLVSSLFRSKYVGESIFAIKGKTPPYIHDFTHGLGFFLIDQPETVSKAYEDIKFTLELYKKLSDEFQIPIVTSLFPQRFQVNQLDRIKTIQDYHLNSSFFDWESPNDIINKFCLEIGIPCVDPLKKFTNQSEVLYLPGGDMHWNAQGHKLMSEELFGWMEVSFLESSH